MLSGIKTAKRKRRRPVPTSSINEGEKPSSADASSVSTGKRTTIPISSSSLTGSASATAKSSSLDNDRGFRGDVVAQHTSSSRSGSSSHDRRKQHVVKSGTLKDNFSAAEELRRKLQCPPSDHQATCSSSSSLPSSRVDQVVRSRADRVLAAQYTQGKSSSGSHEANQSVLVSGTSHPSEGHQKKGHCNEDDMTIQELVAQERKSQCRGDGKAMSMDEVYARNIARVGSHYKGTELAPGSKSGADETDQQMDTKMFNKRRLSASAAFEHEKSRQIARQSMQNKIASKCFWWLESSSFEKHMLLSLGEHLSMVMTPCQYSITKGQCCIVPIKHAESFVCCEDEVWEELLRFKTSLRNMYNSKNNKRGGGVLFCETVLPSNGFWQTKIDVIPVPKRVEQDAPMYFKSALTEQAEEWGTHTKLLSTRNKGLRRTIPKGFSYFSVEWDGGGYAQIIESSAFPKDFGIDTIAGMMELDPVRFRRKQKSFEKDKAAVLDFCGSWKDFDWTLELDNKEE